MPQVDWEKVFFSQSLLKEFIAVAKLSDHLEKAKMISKMIFRAINGVRRLADAMVIIMFAIMMCGVLVQVGGRYFFNYSISGTEEMARFAQMWMVLVGAGVAMRLGRHVAIDVLVTFLPVVVSRVLNGFIAVGSLWFLYLIFVAALPLMEVGKFETSPALEIPMWTMYLSLMVGSFYFAIEVALWLVERWKNPRAKQEAMD
jgi:TRAP-type C4-dicarboxylate transport system permease small subunit